MTESQQLLAEYANRGSEAAFRQVVTRYVDLVYSAAVRLVKGDIHLAEDVTQTVFADLAKLARSLSRDVMLGGWLHRHTCFVAGKTLRAERRRLAREREAVEMNSQEDHSAANLALVAPVLDEAINQLSAEDRSAILLRFFEQRDFRTVGEALGSNEEAARKRVDRALEKLELLLKRRGVALSATALAATLATQAVSAAPACLAVNVSSAALAGAAAGGGTATTILNIMSMTKLKIGLVSALVFAGVAIPLVIHQRAQTGLAEANAALAKQNTELSRLAAENERLAKQAERAASPKSTTNDPSRELLRLRGEVGRLRRETALRTNGPSALSSFTADPVMWKTIRDQQKMGLSMIYKEFGKRANLPADQGEKLADVLADEVMENIDRITEILRDGKGPQQAEPVLAAQEDALKEKVQSLLGPDAYAQYLDYTKNLASFLTAEQFKGMLSGEKEEKDAKAKRLYEEMRAETQRTLAHAGLPADYQTVPTLNFRNFAFESVGDKNLKLLEGIYERVSASAGSFLSPEEISKFGEFRASAVNANRMGLALNRKMMTPGGK